MTQQEPNKKKVENREEGVFYDEEFENDCCAECHDVTFEKTYPAHTAYHACINMKCSCHQEPKESLEEKIVDILLKHHYPSQDFLQNDRKAVEEIASLFRQAISTAVEEAKRDGFGCVKMEVKYLVCPGKVVAHDGDEHYISASQLMSLYKVNPLECKIIDSPQAAFGLKWEDYIVLRPNTRGDYSLPGKSSNKN